MKLIVLFLFLLITSFNYSQDNKKNWLIFSDELIVTIEVDKTDTYKINDLNLDVIWDSKLSYSDNIGYYGGIKSLTIYKENKKLQIINDIEDNIALGFIFFRFYDYNFDGYLDFTLPINSRWEMYFIYNPQTNKFDHREDWDYLRIQKIDRKNKRILSEQDGNYGDNRKIYQIKGIELIELN